MRIAFSPDLCYVTTNGVVGNRWPLACIAGGDTEWRDLHLLGKLFV